MSYRSANPFSAAGLLRWLDPVVDRFPRGYLVGLSLAALPGIAVLALIPVMVLVSLSAVAEQFLPLPEQWTLPQLAVIAAWSLVFVYSSLLTWQLMRMRLPLPQGLMLQVEQFPALQAQLQKLQEHYQVKPVSRITITERFELRVIYTPRFGLPFWPTATLCIGMPVLQCLSAKQLGCLLAGQLGQHASPYSRWLHQLNKLQQLFKGYRLYFDKGASWLQWPLRLLFRLYQPFYHSASIFASQWDELEADRYSLELYHGEELLEAMLSYIACQQFLQRQYWPEVVNRLQKEPPQKALPHTRMSGVIRRALASGKTNALLHEQFKMGFDGKNRTIPLKRRMENIGYDTLKAPSVLIKNASHELLGQGEKKIIDFMDKLWVSRNLADWKKVQQKRNQKRLALQQLQKQSDNRLLSADELWKQARLTEKLHGETKAAPYYKALLQKNPKHARGLYAYGRILLRQQDSNGIRLLEQAMQEEAALTPQACMLLFKFLVKQNQKQRAMLYRNRALSFRQQSAA
jgi:hypothetical protein